MIEVDDQLQRLDVARPPPAEAYSDPVVDEWADRST
jgi:hypothetical protein